MRLSSWTSNLHRLLHGSFICIQMLCNAMAYIIMHLMFFLLQSTFLKSSRHRPLSIPYACSDTTRADLNFLLKLISARSLVVSGKAFISHIRDGKALSPTVTKGISPYSGRFNDVLGNTSPCSNALKIGQDCKRVEPCIEPTKIVCDVLSAPYWLRSTSSWN